MHQSEAMVSIPSARRRQLRTWVPTPGVEQGADLLRLDGSTNSAPGLHDLASNDYLSLARHPVLRDAATRAMNEQGVGSGGPAW